MNETSGSTVKCCDLWLITVHIPLDGSSSQEVPKHCHPGVGQWAYKSIKTVGVPVYSKFPWKLKVCAADQTQVANMGQLKIRLISAKAFDTKEGAYVSFRLVPPSSEKEEVRDEDKKRKSGRAKTKAFKSKPESWNDSVTLQTPNQLKGCTLKIRVREVGGGASGWAKLKGEKPIGEAILNVEDLISGIEKDNWCTLYPCVNPYKVKRANTNRSGNLHIGLEYRVDPKVKIIIAYGNETLRAFELLRDVKLETQLDAVCQTMKASGNPADYVFQVERTQHIINQEDMKNPSFFLPDKCLVHLIIHPTLQAQSAIDCVRDITKQKKSLFDLKTHMMNRTFTQAFVNCNGIEELSTVIGESVGNTQAYALSALESCLQQGFGWDRLSPQLISKIVQLIFSKESNVRIGALKTVANLSDSKNYGIPSLSLAINRTYGDTFWGDVAQQNLQGQVDVSAQSLTLSFFNRMLSGSSQAERRRLVSLMEAGHVTKLCSNLRIIGDTDVQQELSRYMMYRYDIHSAQEPYNREDEDHEAMLLEYWYVLCPSKKLDNRTSELWKSIGFQGTDPATDFRAMGITALRCLLYCARNHGRVSSSDFPPLTRFQILKEIIYFQNEHPDTFYPVSVAGINLISMIYNVLQSPPPTEGEAAELLNVRLMYDHVYPLEEIFSICVEYFNRAWLQADVTESVTIYLWKCNTMDELKKSLLTTAPVDRDNRQTIRNRKKSMTATLRKKNTKKEPLHEHVRTGDTRLVQTMIKNGAEVNSRNAEGLSSLHIAVTTKNTDMVRLLLWKDADVNIKTDEGWSPLHEACKSGTMDMIDVLLGKSADVRAGSNDGMTPLHLLVGRKLEPVPQHVELVLELLARGAAVNAVTKNNTETPLHCAAREGSLDICKALVLNGADVSAKSKTSTTPLHISITCQHPSLTKFLLDNGSDPTVVSYQGTPFDIASALRDKETIDMLTQNPHRNVPTLPKVESLSFGRVLRWDGDSDGKKMHTFRSNMRQRLSFFPQMDIELAACKFFHPAIDDNEAERIVVDTTFGDSFLLRESNVRGTIILTRVSGPEISHHMIIYKFGGFTIQDEEDTIIYEHINDITTSKLLQGHSPVSNEVTLSALSIQPSPLIHSPVTTLLRSPSPTAPSLELSRSQERASSPPPQRAPPTSPYAGGVFIVSTPSTVPLQPANLSFPPLSMAAVQSPTLYPSPASSNVSPPSSPRIEREEKVPLSPRVDRTPKTPPPPIPEPPKRLASEYEPTAPSTHGESAKRSFTVGAIPEPPTVLGPKPLLRQTAVHPNPLQGKLERLQVLVDQALSSRSTMTPSAKRELMELVPSLQDLL
ncbi:ankyrin repeat protein [Planoprotostelium fungivorum]|uniref:Ankyrin repeat protein n=1 Tax=Planoprotostelium fungivorum TaxID=1890364 RepID=A0A2P6MVG0_9EUKA|nr:ankyrin repeat protein [Planoprotostelium fungivorum]